MQLSVDDEGMEIQVELDTENNTEARNLYSAIERRYNWYVFHVWNR